MKTILPVGLITLIGASMTFAQPDLRVSGYAINFPIYQRINSTLASVLGTRRDLFVDVTRLRVRPSLGLWEDAFVTLEYEVNATYFSSPIPFPPAVVQNNKQIVDLTWNPVNGPRWSVIHFIDRLYFKQITSLVEVTVGRQRISWGTGRIWNPTDLFNPINPTSFTKVEKDGVDAVTAKFILGNFTDASAVVNPHKNLKGTDAGVRFRTNTQGYDISFMAGSFQNRSAVGLDFAGSVFDAGVRGEALILSRRASEAGQTVKYILGADNQFSEDFYALMEFHFNGEGKDNPLDYDPSALQAGTALNLGREFLAIQASYLPHPLVSLTGGYIISLTDGSGFMSVSVSYSATERITLSAGGQGFHGQRLEEYWFYPSSLYGRIDCFF